MRGGRVARERRALRSPNIVNRGLIGKPISRPDGILSKDRTISGTAMLTPLGRWASARSSFLTERGGLNLKLDLHFLDKN
jgi:hypothetical protein